MSQQPNNSFSGTILAGGSFIGTPQVCNGSVSIVCYLDTLVDLLIEVYQSVDGTTFNLSSSYDAIVSLHGNQLRTQFYVKTKYFKVKLTNSGAVPAFNVILTTLLTTNNHDGTPEQPSSVINNQLTSTATRGVSYLVLGTWYRVATVGNTSGAVWAEIGAIVDGESVPAIGRLFQCAYVYGTIAGEGTCYDVEYNTNPTTVSGTVTVSNFPATQTVDGTVKITDTYGGTIATTAGNLMVGIGNIYTANPLHTILDSGVVSLSPSLNTADYNSGAIIAGGFTGTTYDMGQNSLFDCLLYATGIIVSGNVRLDYSVDGVTWIPNNTSTALATISSTDPHFVYLGIKSGSRYVRVSSGAGSTFRTTTNLQMTFSSKRD